MFAHSYSKANKSDHERACYGDLRYTSCYIRSSVLRWLRKQMMTTDSSVWWTISVETSTSLSCFARSADIVGILAAP